MKRRKPLPSTVPRRKLPRGPVVVALPRRANRPRPPTRAAPAKPAVRAVHPRPSGREVARIIDDGDKSLVDVLDSLLNQGVVVNADLVLALADVDLVYVRLSALLCAADRVFPRKDA
jgi:hypothetical protein